MLDTTLPPRLDVPTFENFPLRGSPEEQVAQTRACTIGLRWCAEWPNPTPRNLILHGSRLEQLEHWCYAVGYGLEIHGATSFIVELERLRFSDDLEWRAVQAGFLAVIAAPTAAQSGRLDRVLTKRACDNVPTVFATLASHQVSSIIYGRAKWREAVKAGAFVSMKYSTIERAEERP